LDHLEDEYQPRSSIAARYRGSEGQGTSRCHQGQNFGAIAYLQGYRKSRGAARAEMMGAIKVGGVVPADAERKAGGEVAVAAAAAAAVAAAAVAVARRCLERIRRSQMMHLEIIISQRLVL
jgi:hypothetical protein